MTKYEHKPNTGSLFRNEKKKDDKHPDYTGNIMIGNELKRISAWLREGKKGKFLSLQISDPKPSNESKQGDDDLPF